MKEDDLKGFGVTAFLVSTVLSLDVLVPKILNELHIMKDSPLTLHELAHLPPRMNPDSINNELFIAGAAFVAYLGVLAISVYRSFDKE